MPIKSAQYDGLNYRRFVEPFTLDDLVELNKQDVADKERRKGFHLPLIEDFSEVDMERLTSQSISHYVMKIKNSATIPDCLTANLVACVVSDVEAFLKLRLYGVYCELVDVRSEEHFYVANDLAEAMTWISRMAQTDPNIVDAAYAHFRDVAEDDLSSLR